ncbi:MAG: hypothetical protein ABIM46_00875 [candidate division WOR-3 bacterium]
MKLMRVRLRPVFLHYEKGVEPSVLELLPKLGDVAEVLLPASRKADGEAFLVYPGGLGAGNIVKQVRKKGDVLLFAGEEPWLALDVLEDLADREHVHRRFRPLPGAQWSS